SIADRSALSLHDALPSFSRWRGARWSTPNQRWHTTVNGRCLQCQFVPSGTQEPRERRHSHVAITVENLGYARLAHANAFGQFARSEEHTSELQSRFDLVC